LEAGAERVAGKSRAACRFGDMAGSTVERDPKHIEPVQRVEEMPRHSKPSQQLLPTRTLVVDNGAYTIKAGFASTSKQPEDCQVIPNCIARDRGKKVWIGSQIDHCTDFGEVVYRRPVEKGYLVSWEAEKAVWDNSFLDQGAKLKVR